MIALSFRTELFRQAVMIRWKPETGRPGLNFEASSNFAGNRILVPATFFKFVKITLFIVLKSSFSKLKEIENIPKERVMSRLNKCRKFGLLILFVPVISLLIIQAPKLVASEADLDPPELLTTARPYHLTFRSGQIYWTETYSSDFCPPNASINKIDVASKVVTTLQTGCTLNPSEIAVDDASVYYVDGVTNSIIRQSVLGGPLVILGNYGAAVTDFGLDNNLTYFTNNVDSGVRYFSKSGSSSGTIGGDYDVTKFVRIGSYLYWVEEASGSVRRTYIPSITGSIETITTDLSRPTEIAVFRGLSTSDIYVYDEPYLMRVPWNGTDPQPLAMIPAGYRLNGMAVSPTHVYWLEDGNTDGTDKVNRIPIGGGVVENMALGRTFSSPDIVLSTTHLYWGEESGIYRLPLDADSASVDLTIADMEITQGIQDLNNAVPLVENKVTTVRVYPSVDLAPTTTTMVLHGTRGGDGAALPGSPLLPLHSTGVAHPGGYNRGVFRDSFDFRLPPSWRTGTVALRAEINPGGSVVESDRDNNFLMLPVTFTPKSAVCVKTVPLQTSTGTIYRADRTGFEEILQRAKSLWPTSAIRNFSTSTPLEQPFGGITGDRTFDIPEDDFWIMWALIEHLIYTDPPSWCNEGYAPFHLVGMVSPETTTTLPGGFTRLGLGSYFLHVSYVKMESISGGAVFSSPRGGTTLAHEMAHNYNGFGNRWLHVNCGLPAGAPFNPGFPSTFPPNQIGPAGPRGDWGYDAISGGRINPISASDYMSLCRPQWVSRYNWLGILNLLPDPTASILPGSESRSLKDDSDQLLIGGILSERHEDILIRGFHFTGELVEINPKAKLSELNSNNANGSYQIEFLDSEENLLSFQPFEPFPAYENEFGVQGGEMFWLATDYVANTASIRISNKGVEVSRLVVSPNKPTVSILNLSLGSVVGDELVIEWSADDADGDNLTYAVQYSHDNGNTWETLAAPYSETSLTIDDTFELHGSDQALIRVIANDGFNLGWATSTPFKVERHSPRVAITSPAEGGVFTKDQQIILTGTAVDPEDGPLTSSSLHWTIDGIESGGGMDVVVPPLAPGKYNVGLTATDSDGNSLQKTIVIFIAAERVYLPAFTGY